MSSVGWMHITLNSAVTSGAGTAIKAYRTADKVGDAGKLGKAIDKVITATKSTYRQALQKATGKLGKGYEAYHTLPQKYRKRFEDLGINIDEPGNVVWRKSEGHRAKSAEHTDAWDEFFANPQATAESARESILRWCQKAVAFQNKHFATVAHTIEARLEDILHYFDERHTNAYAESLNAKTKTFRAALRGVKEVKFFLYRLSTIFS